MRKVFLGGMVVALAALAAACSSGINGGINQSDVQAHVDAINKDADIVDEVVSILETVKDEASAKAAKPKLDELLKKHRELLKANESLPRLSGKKEYNAFSGRTHLRTDAAEKKLREQHGRIRVLNIPSSGVIMRILDEFTNAFSSTKSNLTPYDPN